MYTSRAFLVTISTDLDAINKILHPTAEMQALSIGTTHSYGGLLNAASATWAGRLQMDHVLDERRMKLTLYPVNS